MIFALPPCCTLSSWVLPLRRSRQTDFWMSHPICQAALSPPLLLSAAGAPSSLLLSLKGQKGGVASLGTNSSSFTFFFFLSPRPPPSLSPLSSSLRLPHLRQSDIYRGTLRLFGSPCSFWWKNTEGSGEEARGLVKELCWKRVKSLKAGFEIFATSAARKYKRERRGFFFSCSRRYFYVLNTLVRVVWFWRFLLQVFMRSVK